MNSRPSRRRAVRRAAVLLTAGAMAVLAMPAADAGTTAATIDTWSSWDPSEGTLGGFGHPDTATYGQVITIPAGKDQVKWFTYYMQAGPKSGTLRLRGAVYGWDGSRATDEIAMTKRKKLELTTGDPEFYPVKLKVKGADVEAGQQYVLFATISKDYEQTDPDVWTWWPVHGTDVLAGGYTVFLNDGGDESEWTTEDWGVIDTYDMAFQAKLG